MNRWIGAKTVKKHASTCRYKTKWRTSGGERQIVKRRYEAQYSMGRAARLPSPLLEPDGNLTW